MKTDQELQQIFLDGNGHSQTQANRSLYDAGYNDGYAAKNPPKAPDVTVGVDHFADGSTPRITGTDTPVQTGAMSTPARTAADLAAKTGSPVVNQAAPADEVITGPSGPDAPYTVPHAAPHTPGLQMPEPSDKPQQVETTPEGPHGTPQARPKVW